MPRSSFSDNPLLRVSRPVSACSRCRAAKVKCDGKLPACTACEKAGRESECSAANDQFARGKERSYVAALELRIEKLERRLAYARSRKASVAMHESDIPLPNADRKDSLATIRAAIHRKAARKRENSDVNALVSDFGYLSVNATTRDFEPAVSNMTFARLVLAAATNDPVPEPRTTKLPSRQAAQAIVHYYMTNIYALFPAFSPTLIISLLDEVYSQDPRKQLTNSDSWLLYLVLAIGSAAQSRGTQDEFYANGVEFVARALPYADRALMPGYVTQITSLLLLTQYSMLDPAHFDSWHLIGFTCRAVIDLGYHQDPPLPQTDKAALDARRRTFYCVYALDRAISMVHARAFSFTDDSIAVDFPSAQSLRGHPSSGVIGTLAADPALLHFQLRRAQSHWYQTLFQSDPNDVLPDAASFIWQMCHDMREWAESLPDTIPIGIRELFDLELRYSYVYCIAPSARAPHMTAYGRMLIFEHAIAYLNRIYEVAHAVMNTAFYTYHDALRVYFMGSQFVAVLRNDGDALISGANVPVPLALPGQPPPPPLPKRFDGGMDNLDRSLRSLERVSLTLKKYGERWEDALALLQSFEMISLEILNWLRDKRRARDNGSSRQTEPSNRQHNGPLQGQMNTTSETGPSTMQPGHNQPGQIQQFQVQWMDVNMSQIKHEAGGAN
ncbi:fungal-specific transcription factor domain-containing protein [Coniochaeta sp. 2T2.1]|nr:fungal-specific transcription factor domain-containing protein [Coniochaeta sp. 2T2.1]